jgi:hypothetical protein
MIHEVSPVLMPGVVGSFHEALMISFLFLALSVSQLLSRRNIRSIRMPGAGVLVCRSFCTP